MFEIKSKKKKKSFIENLVTNSIYLVYSRAHYTFFISIKTSICMNLFKHPFKEASTLLYMNKI